MDTQYFPHFIRSNYKALDNEPNELLIELGDEFKKYLEDKFKNNIEKLNDIWNIDPKHIIMMQVNKAPFRINGYHPVLILHFEEFFKKGAEEARNEQNKIQ
jgi:hypothetical protein